MGVDARHPLYTERFPDWESLTDAYEGERQVKEKSFRYLPATAGMIEDGAHTRNTTSSGWQAYDAYRKRSRFPDVVSDAVDAMAGVMHSKPPTIELPAAMEPMRENATLRNESLAMLLRRINEEQLKTGRIGLLGDVIDVGERKGTPYISSYLAKDVINWDEGQRSRDAEAGADADGDEEGIEPQNLNLVSLDESGPERVDDFEWEEQAKYRVCILGDPDKNEPQGEGTYRVGVFRDNNTAFDINQTMEPKINGNTSDLIPFVFINTKDIVADPDKPPLLGLSDLAYGIYRGEADYRQSLFLQGQDTFVTIGGKDDEQHRLGAGATINIPNIGGDAKFVGVESSGISEQRESLENDYERAEKKSGQMLNQQSGSAESGDALRIRVASRTATLNQVALTGAFGLQMLLRIIARWMGADPAQVVVTPNLDFADDSILARELVEFMTAKSMGAPLSLETIHDEMQRKSLTEKTFEEEVAQIETEKALELAIGSSNPNGPENDPDDPNPDDPNNPNPGDQGGGGGG